MPVYVCVALSLHEWHAAHGVVFGRVKVERKSIESSETQKRNEKNAAGLASARARVIQRDMLVASNRNAEPSRRAKQRGRLKRANWRDESQCDEIILILQATARARHLL